MQKSYLNYLTESLGIEDFIAPKSRPTSGPQTSASTPALAPLNFFISAPLSPAGQDLLSKMTQAMGYTLESIPVRLMSDISQASAKVCVVFSDDETSAELGQWADQGECLQITTYSPELLVQKPQLKKATWAHLQDVMRKLVQ